MEKLLLRMKVGGKRDVLEARQRARQIAGLLGFDTREQACIAASVFALACQVHRQKTGTDLFFQVEDRVLRIFFAGTPTATIPASLRIEKPLPAQTFFTDADMHWMVRELVRRPPPTLFEELEKLNQELLRILLETQPEPLERPLRPPAATEKTA